MQFDFVLVLVGWVTEFIKIGVAASQVKNPGGSDMIEVRRIFCTCEDLAKSQVHLKMQPLTLDTT